MATRRLAWVLNLDADLELAAGPGYEPRKTVRAGMKPHVAQLATSLVGDDDLLVDETSPVGSAAGARGRAFCPTPRAIAILERAGAEPEPHPSLEILRRVNSRAFASGLGATLPDAAFVTDAAVLRRMLRAEPSISATWRVKHAFGMTGRNQRVIDPATLREPDLASVEGWMKSGNGVQIEPDVAIDNEYAMHAFIAQDGTFERGAIVAQRCDARGGWIATERLAALPSALGDLAERLAREVDMVAAALFAAGYFGPFGIDAYTYRDRAGTLAFQPRSEINARYSMGFAIGFDRDRLP
jgi:hypothetical protein